MWPAGQVALQRRAVMVRPAHASGQVPPPGTGVVGTPAHTGGGGGREGGHNTWVGQTNGQAQEQAQGQRHELVHGQAQGQHGRVITRKRIEA